MDIKIGGLLVLYWGEWVKVVAIINDVIYVENYETGQKEEHFLNEITAVISSK